MNSNYLTNTKDYDYRFQGRLVVEIFGKDTLEKGCVKLKDHTTGPYDLLDSTKFDFVNFHFHLKKKWCANNFIFFIALFRERVKNDKSRFEALYRHVNSKCSSLRNKKKWYCFQRCVIRSPFLIGIREQSLLLIAIVLLC